MSGLAPADLGLVALFSGFFLALSLLLALDLVGDVCSGGAVLVASLVEPELLRDGGGQRRNRRESHRTAVGNFSAFGLDPKP